MITAIERIRIQISAKNGITVDELIGQSHEHVYVQARREFATEARKFGFSLPAIGRYLGGRHHTTILHLLRTKDRVLK